MTPAEAREIDRLEFEAECAAIRQRAYALLPDRPSLAAQPPALSRAACSRSALYTVGPVTLTIAEWASHAGLGVAALRNRLRTGWSIEAAMTTPSRRRRGGGLESDRDP